jgi:hypothetical protein
VKEGGIKIGNLANLGREDKLEESQLVTHTKFGFNVWFRCF